MGVFNNSTSFLEEASLACKHTYKSVNKKIELIRDNVAKIKQLLDELNNNRKEENIIKELEINFFMFCEGIYSCMEYCSYILRCYQNSVDKYRGNTTPTGFNDVLKGYRNNNSKPIYKSIRFTELLSEAMQWYPLVHDIRSKEIHYSMGQVEIINDIDVNYISNIEYGGYRAVGFNLLETNLIFAKFQDFIDKFLYLVDNKII